MWQGASVSTAVIRPAQESDLARLVEVELAAGALFHDVGLHEVAEHEATVAELRTPYDEGRIWVAQEGEEIAGYVMAEVLDGNAHVAQVSVDPAWSRRGTGRRLVAVVEDWGRAAGRPATTLTTFRDVPFNGPYYARLGYREVAPEEIGPELAATMAREAALPGIDASRRCAMRKESS